jgi:hypothetical protein
MIYRQTDASTRRRPAILLAGVLVVLALAAPAASMAASPSHDQYDPKSQQIAATGSGGGGGGSANTASSGSSVGSLPFTGLDVGVLALAAVALLGAGFALRRLSDPARRSPS